MGKEIGGGHRLGLIALLGLVSGLPYLLTGGTLLVRLRVEAVGSIAIGYFAWAHLPYTLKFLWAPFLDRYQLPFLSRRRGWMLLAQLVLVFGIATLGFLQPSGSLVPIFVVAVLVCFASASLDIVIDAYRTEVLEENERGKGGSLFVTGYRAAMVVAGAGVLILADHLSWELAYLLLAGLMLLSIVVTFSAEPSKPPDDGPRSLKEAAVDPFVDFASRKGVWLVAGVLLLFKLGEGIAGHWVQTFLTDVGFSLSALGTINKGIGLPASVAGTLLGGVAVSYIGVKRSLLIFGLMQAAPNLLYSLLLQEGPNALWLVGIVSVDQFCNGLATAAFVVFLMTLCDRRYTAFQYAAFSSLSSVVGRVVSGWSGYWQESLGWELFFVMTALASLPALLLLCFMKEGAGYPGSEAS